MAAENGHYRVRTLGLGLTVTGEGRQSPLHQMPAQFLFFAVWKLCIAQGVNDALPSDDAVGPYGLGHQRHRGDLSDGDARPLHFGRDRSAAASAGASGRGENHGIDSRFL